MEKKDVFISYSRKDTKIADQICAAFDRAGITYFIDRQGIGGGREFPFVLAKAIMECKLFLFLASENSYESKFTNSEITFAFNEKPKNCLLPYIIDGSKMPLEMRFIFSGINWRNTDDHPIETILIEDVRGLLGRERNQSYERKGSNGLETQVPTIESPETLFSKAWKLDQDKNYLEAIKLYFKAAELGHPAAQCKLGDKYYNGEGVTKNYVEAVKWYHKAADQGYSAAQDMLGHCYQRGDGVLKDLSEGVKWFRKSAEQGNAQAQRDLAGCYRFGLGVSRNSAEAVKWFRKSAEQGHRDSQYQLACRYYHGEGIERDFSESARWMRKAAEQGEPIAQYYLGELYRNGQGVSKDYEEAKRWFRKSAEQGDAKAKKALQEMEAAEKSAKPRVGRNDPCPCGSGRKYINCHGRGIK